MAQQLLFDSIIVGGGPAGLSAAIYLSRFNRRTLVIDRGHGRTASHEVNQNYLGFPQGIHSQQLVELGRTQAEAFGTTFETDPIHTISAQDDSFTLQGENSQYQGRSLILATGVKDLYPNLPDAAKYLGISLFWCITCDGFKTLGKKVIVIGDNDEAACTALQFLQFTKQVELVTNYPQGKATISAEWRERLRAAGVPLWEAEIKEVVGEGGQIQELVLATEKILNPDFVFSMQGAVPNNSLATQLGVLVNAEGYIETDDEQRTNVKRVYAAGDVTRRFSHQIATAVHEGSMAAQAANYDLYESFQRMI